MIEKGGQWLRIAQDEHLHYIGEWRRLIKKNHVILEHIKDIERKDEDCNESNKRFKYRNWSNDGTLNKNSDMSTINIKKSGLSLVGLNPKPENWILQK